MLGARPRSARRASSSASSCREKRSCGGSGAGGSTPRRRAPAPGPQAPRAAATRSAAASSPTASGTFGTRSGAGRREVLQRQRLGGVPPGRGSPAPRDGGAGDAQLARPPPASRRAAASSGRSCGPRSKSASRSVQVVTAVAPASRARAACGEERKGSTVSAAGSEYRSAEPCRISTVSSKGSPSRTSRLSSRTRTAGSEGGGGGGDGRRRPGSRGEQRERASRRRRHERLLARAWKKAASGVT